VATYASVYMVALGCSATQVGLITSVGLVLAVVLSFVGGPITDRLGRKRTTLLFDFVAWGGGMLLWAVARGFPWFLAAAVVNSFVRIVQTSWTCLMVEDTPPVQRVTIYAWVYVAGVVAGMDAPLAGLLVGRFGLVPAMRGLYVFAFVVLITMFLVRNRMLTETSVGVARMRESRRAPVLGALADYRRVAGLLLRRPLTIVAFFISTLVSIHGVLRGTFFAILLTEGLGFRDALIAVFPALGAGVTLVVYLLVLPSVSRRGTAFPLVLGLALSAAGGLLLALSPAGSILVVTLSTVLSAAGAAIIVPHSDSLVANTVPEPDRAAVMSLYYMLVFGASSPFGWLGGVLFARGARLPFLLAAGVLGAALLLALLVPRLERGARKHGTVPMKE
jgi:MFS transporter, DHA1 family, tetracycline resistance protein